MVLTASPNDKVGDLIVNTIPDDYVIGGKDTIVTHWADSRPLYSDKGNERVLCQYIFLVRFEGHFMDTDVRSSLSVYFKMEGLTLYVLDNNKVPTSVVTTLISGDDLFRIMLKMVFGQNSSGFIADSAIVVLADEPGIITTARVSNCSLFLTGDYACCVD